MHHSLLDAGDIPVIYQGYAEIYFCFFDKTNKIRKVLHNLGDQTAHGTCAVNDQCQVHCFAGQILFRISRLVSSGYGIIPCSRFRTRIPSGYFV